MQVGSGVHGTSITGQDDRDEMGLCLEPLMWAGSRGYVMEPKFPAVLTDDELAQITVPTLLVTGARSALLTPAQARERASHMPHAEVVIIPGSHGGFNRIDELNERMAAFIAGHSRGTG